MPLTCADVQMLDLGLEQSAQHLGLLYDGSLPAFLQVKGGNHRTPERVGPGDGEEHGFTPRSRLPACASAGTRLLIGRPPGVCSGSRLGTWGNDADQLPTHLTTNQVYEGHRTTQRYSVLDALDQAPSEGKRGPVRPQNSSRNDLCGVSAGPRVPHDGNDRLGFREGSWVRVAGWI